MSNYIQTTIFTPKDSLPTTDPNKTIFGAAYDVEFGNIATAIATKVDINSNATLASLNVTGSTIPANGIYLPAANTLGFSSNTTQRATVNSTGNWVFQASTSGDTLQIISLTGVRSLITGVTGQTNNPRLFISHTEASGTTNLDFEASTGTVAGNIQVAGTSAMSFASTRAITIQAPSSGISLTINSVAAGNFLVATDGTVTAQGVFSGTATNFGSNSNHPFNLLSNNTARVVIAAAGAVTINAPSSGVAFTVNGNGASNAMQVNGAGISRTCVFDSTNANGSFIGFSNSGSEFADIGSAKSIITSGLSAATLTDLAIGASAATSVTISTNAVGRLQVNGTGNVSIGAPSSGTSLAVTGITGNNAQTWGDGTTTAFLGIFNTPAISFGVSTAAAVNLVTNNSNRIVISSGGNVSINAPASGNVALNVSGVANSNTCVMTAASTSGQSFGLVVAGGTTSADYAIVIENQAATTNFFKIFGDGHGFLGFNGTQNISWDTSGRFTIAAPLAGIALTVNGFSSNNGVIQSVVTTTGTAFYASTTLMPALGLASASNFGLIQNDASNTWSLAQGTALNALGTPILQWNTTPQLLGRGPVAAALVDMTPDKGTFTMTFTGFTANPTGTASWSRMGNHVVLVIPAATGTSNATTMTATGMPAAIQPNTTQWCYIQVENSSVTPAGPSAVELTSGSTTLTFSNGVSVGASMPVAFTNSGTKGIPFAQTICYHLV